MSVLAVAVMTKKKLPTTTTIRPYFVGLRTLVGHPISMRKRLLIYGFFLVATVFAMVRITNAYVDYQRSLLHLPATHAPAVREALPPKPQQHQQPICPYGDPCRQRLVNFT